MITEIHSTKGTHVDEDQWVPFHLDLHEHDAEAATRGTFQRKKTVVTFTW